MQRSTAEIILLTMCALAVHSILISCQEEEPVELFFEEEELLISAYLEEHSEEYSSLFRILEILLSGPRILLLRRMMFLRLPR